MTFFTYLKNFLTLTSDGMPTEYNSIKAMTLSMIDINYVDKCVKDSFDGSKDMELDDNTDLRMMQKEWQDYGHKIYPSLIVNDVTFRGTMNPKNVVEAVCSGFDKMPRACRKFMRKEGIVLNNRHGGVSHKLLALIILALIVTGLIIMLMYRRCMKTEMQQEMKMQVSSAVSQYIALS